MLTIKITSVTEVKVSEEQFAQWIKDTIHNVGYDKYGLSTVEDVNFYLAEDDTIEEYSESYESGDKDITIEGISDEKIVEIIAKKIAETKAEEEEEEEE